jgi:2-amino-4-hydroxy-6-hydroxymethyldihydropteridine diphosphokinase
VAPNVKPCLPCTRIVVGLGANLGDPVRTFRRAALECRRLGRVVAGSRLYGGPALTLTASPPQPDYVNAALLIDEVRLSPLAVVSALLEIERDSGRIRTVPWAPRTLDLDLLYAGDTELFDVAATVPHPRLAERAFALRPLLDVWPHACCPANGTSYRHILDQMGPDLLRVVGGSEWAAT